MYTCCLAPPLLHTQHMCAPSAMVHIKLAAQFMFFGRMGEPRSACHAGSALLASQGRPAHGMIWLHMDVRRMIACALMLQQSATCCVGSVVLRPQLQHPTTSHHHDHWHSMDINASACFTQPGHLCNVLKLHLNTCLVQHESSLRSTQSTWSHLEPLVHSA